LKLTAKQQEANALLQTPCKHILLDGGSRSGKTALFVRAICTRAIKAPRSRHAILRFRFSHVKESIGMDTLPKVMQSCYPQVPCKINKSDWFMPLPNGSEVWLGGIDDKERTEKILGKEFATILLNECSQIPYNSRNLIVTRLAQKCEYNHGGEIRTLALKMYYDQNPPSKSHWAYQLFYLHRDPESKQTIPAAEEYAHLTINPRDNLENLPADYIASLEKLPARLKRRFLDGLYGDSAPDALWTEEIIERWREESDELPRMVRIVVAIDPSGSGDEDNAANDEIGIVAVGLGIDGNAHLLEDASVKGGPKVWGDVATSLYDRHMANMIVAETNFGGEMVRFVVQAAKPNVPFKKLTASRGKSVRAEPVSVLHEQGKIRFAGQFIELEEELCGFTSRGYLGPASPNRADAFVWAVSELFPGVARSEPAPRQVAEELPSHWMG
jgi:phage terminase large subunit-like protein